MVRKRRIGENAHDKGYFWVSLLVLPNKIENTEKHTSTWIIFAQTKTSEQRIKIKNIPIMYRMIFRAMGFERAYKPQKAEWVQVAALAAGLGASLLGGASSASAARKAERLRKEQDAKNEALYNRRYNESYIDTAAGRNAIQQATDYAKEMNKKAEGSAAVTGGTDAATAQAKEAGNRMIGQTIGNLAAQDTQRRENADAAFAQQQANSTSQQMSIAQQRADAIAQVAGGASNALIQGATMVGSTNTPQKAGNAQVKAANALGEQAKANYNALSDAQKNGILPTQPSMQEYADAHGMPTDEQMGYKRRDGLIG